jgi:hypothetical protein
MDHVLAMYFKFKIFLAQLELDFIYYSSTKSQNLLFQTLLQKTPHRIMHVFSNQIMWADYVVNIFFRKPELGLDLHTSTKIERFNHSKSLTCIECRQQPEQKAQEHAKFIGAKR